jgi:hypothetical protein
MLITLAALLMFVLSVPAQNAQAAVGERTAIITMTELKMHVESDVRQPEPDNTFTCILMNVDNTLGTTPEEIFTIGIPQAPESDGTLLTDGAMLTFYYKNGQFIYERQVL